MADRVLREPCDEHGRYEAHYLTTPEDAADGPTDTFDGEPCPGGRDVTIDYERIEAILVEFGGDWYDMVIQGRGIYDFGRVLAAIAAAIGDDE